MPIAFPPRSGGLFSGTPLRCAGVGARRWLARRCDRGRIKVQLSSSHKYKNACTKGTVPAAPYLSDICSCRFIWLNPAYRSQFLVKSTGALPERGFALGATGAVYSMSKDERFCKSSCCCCILYCFSKSALLRARKRSRSRRLRKAPTGP